MDVTLSKIAQPVTLKLELFQHTGSFKARGAFSTVLGNDIPKAALPRLRAAIMARRRPMPPTWPVCGAYFRSGHRVSRQGGEDQEFWRDHRSGWRHLL
jgi:hypothetical protein